MNLWTPHRPHEECGVFGIYNHQEAAKLTYFGLYALQHRGQESAGIVTSDGRTLREHKAMGLVPDIFNEGILSNLPGHMAVGHVRYSTTGASLLKNAQPFTICHKGKTMALAHNGNLVNARSVRCSLENKGSIFQSTMDSEVILHLIARSAHKGLDEAFTDAFSLLKGAYSILMLTEDKLIGIRDPRGFRPLCLGKLNDCYVLASETCALDLVEAQYIRDVEPGEIVIIDQNGLHSIKPFPAVKHSFCVFELIYFARPDSNIFGTNVYMARKRMGELLAKEAKVKGDFVMPFPDSGNYAAVGVAQASHIPFELGVIRNHYVGRTFIQPSQSMRDFGVKVKLNPVRCLLKNKRVIIVEDSIVRGTTSRTRVRTIREAGAREVHMLVSCPPHRFPCYYGVDFSTLGELIASKFSVEEIRGYLSLDSLHYLSLEGLLNSVNGEQNNYCLACFDGNYPIPLEEEFSKLCPEKKS